MSIRLLVLFTLVPLFELYLLFPPGRRVVRDAIAGAAARRFGVPRPTVNDTD